MKKIIFLLLCLMVYHTSLFADLSSTNYGLSDDRFTSGGGSASSTNYQAAETALLNFGQASMSSTNYASEGKTGIAGAAPIASITSVSPSDYSKFFSDGNASYTITALDPDSDTLQYLAKQDTTTKVAAQSSSTTTWALSSSDLGRHAISLQVLDPDGTVSSQQADYVVRHPVK